MIPIIYKNVLTPHLKIERFHLSEMYRAWSAIYCQSDKMDGEANEGVGIIGRSIRLRMDAIDAELNVRRRMGDGRAVLVLPELTEAPTAVAS